MISYQEALRIIANHAALPHTERLPILSALGCVSAVDLTSPMQVPGFRNSAMDGFAVKRSVIAAATAATPIKLDILGAIAAGDATHISEASGAVQIMTGAPVPEEYDAIIPVEDVAITDSEVEFRRPAKENENIRFPGEDVQLDQRVLSRGDVINAERVMLLTALGISEVDTYKLPEIHIISTGKEITDHLNQPLKNGQIYNSNAPYLLARCMEYGIKAHYAGIIADDATAFEKLVSTIPSGAIIITTGAVSKGIWDFIPGSLKQLGAITHFHRVNIRPGKPVLFATLPNGNRFFGLPGNPISAAISFRFFVIPLVRVMQGMPEEQPVMARLENTFTKKGNFRQFLKTNLKLSSSGEFVCNISSGQESFKISPMAESNAWAVLDEEISEYKAGDIVPVFTYKTLNIMQLAHHKTKENQLCKAA